MFICLFLNFIAPTVGGAGHIFHLNLTGFQLRVHTVDWLHTCTHSAARRNIAILHLYNIIDKPDFHRTVKIHATHTCCVRSHPGFTLAAALKAKYPQGLPSAFQSKQPVIQQCWLTLNFLRIAPAATYSRLKHTPTKLLSYLTINIGTSIANTHACTNTRAGAQICGLFVYSGEQY